MSLHDSESRVTEPSTMEGLQMASSIYAPIAEISSLATNPEGLQPMEPAQSQDSMSQQPLCKFIGQIKRPGRLAEEIN